MSSAASTQAGLAGNLGQPMTVIGYNVPFPRERKVVPDVQFSAPPVGAHPRSIVNVQRSEPTPSTPREHQGSRYEKFDNNSDYAHLEFFEPGAGQFPSKIAAPVATKNPDNDTLMKSLGRYWQLPAQGVDPSNMNITPAAGFTQPLVSNNDSGTRDDGRLMSVRGVSYGDLLASHTTKEWDNHMQDPTTDLKRLTEQQVQKQSIPVQNDDVYRAFNKQAPTITVNQIAKPGQPDTEIDINQGKYASSEHNYTDKSNNQHNGKYKPIKQAHPSDTNGMHLYNMNNEHKLRKALNDILELQNIVLSAPNQNNKQTQKLSVLTPANGSQKSTQDTQDRRRYNDSTIKEDRRNFDTKLDRNQVMIDNDRTPININVSCNQQRPPFWAQTPDLYNRQFDNDVDSDRCYGNSLSYWYNNNNGSDVYLAGRRWRQGAGTGNPSMTDSMFYPSQHRRWGSPQHNRNDPSGQWLLERPSAKKQQVIGAPYAPYAPYGHIVQADREHFRTRTPHFTDPARVSFNRISHMKN